jgi:sigma-B regulation protein RsbU (phosphoserine phosphatase)
MADAVGHGMPAALLTMFIKNALVTKQLLPPSGYRLLRPGETMARLNDVLVGQNLSHATFATAIYGLINTETLELSFSRGGHPAPLLLRGSGEVETPEADGSLLGIFENETFAERTVQLAPGDRLFVFTDGVEVAFATTDPTAPASSDLEQPIDTNQWRDELVRRRNLPTEDLLAEFCAKIDTESGSIHPRDDLTIIVIEVK